MSIDIEHIKKVRQEADCLYNEKEIMVAIKQLSQDLTEQLSDSNPLIYCVMNGGLIFTGLLLPLLQFPLECSYIHATRYRNKLTGSELNWKVAPVEDMTNRTVLVLDDILDEGYTLEAIMAYCKKRGAKKVLSAVLLDKEHDHKAQPNMKPDFCRLTVEDRFLFGFGLDYHGYWRNANGIFALNPQTVAKEN